MAIQKDTNIEEFSIQIRDEKGMVEKVNAVNFDDLKYHVADENNANLVLREFYIEGNAFFLTAELNEGEIYIDMKIPISKELLVDFLSHNIRTMNKIKTILENLS